MLDLGQTVDLFSVFQASIFGNMSILVRIGPSFGLIAAKLCHLPLTVSFFKMLKLCRL